MGEALAKPIVGGGGWGQRICPHCGSWEPLGSQEQQRVHLVELLRPAMGEALAISL
jgi:hypothetical protein